ncbi:MAG: hypothetical protein QXF15_01495 [Candidatus Aenigmatarchaeota archaeon]|nr:hypothetical protein [Candidatus Aenigmarchaeota archaeon]
MVESLSKEEILNYYSNKIIQEKILSFSKNREVVSVTSDGIYLKRPDILLYSRDIVERVEKGAVAFHCSVEHWSQPMSITSNELELNKLRCGFDLIIDIDSKVKLEHSKECAIEVCEFLKQYSISPTIKFSGRRGFHIAIASNAFPEKINGKSISEFYPNLPRLISSFISEKIKDRLLERLVALEGGYSSLINLIPSLKELSPYEFVEIEKNWGVRHLFRMPYSFNEKTWKISIPIKISDIKNFNIEWADFKKPKIYADFLINKKDEANDLIDAAFKWAAETGFFKPQKIEEKKKNIKIGFKIPEKYFPPCIKNILKGLSDGKKRSIFTIITFLQNVGWNIQDIEKILLEWNSKNTQKLSERYITTQIKWHARQSRVLMPANCDSDLYYKSIGICQKNENCKKNPVNYAISLYLKEMKNNKSIKKNKNK